MLRTKEESNVYSQGQTEQWIKKYESKPNLRRTKKTYELKFGDILIVWVNAFVNIASETPTDTNIV